ncbi:N5-carboxyaminoimidazole ribonucleotide mutase [Candidatus Lokiarchaeum ossiferum]|uniref:N5-carboxyaminoimidazole ribonucleotide mutase n=1 Tax=Candidatus Lokiarchaeum ossiferum TaxID=2951803 RepID=A0ABY6HXI9_9ARCH|nr:N5-carboxyaminoimidazole ribonucleotide mutase [Candidatus Lokiarchaeum sp. B-35]
MKELRDILKDLEANKITVDQAEEILKLNYLNEIDELAQLDLFRKSRTGIPEVIFAESKSVEMLQKITAHMMEKSGYAILTRVTKEQFSVLDAQYKSHSNIQYQPNYQGKVIFIAKQEYKKPENPGLIGLITAGTSDIPVAEEANVVLKAMGYQTLPSYDVGIAGMHRIFPPLKKMIKAHTDVLIVFAGMEGTLPGVVSSLVDIPVIGVPTSTGYGLGEKGKGALTTMLQSCSPGISVVNINNGFGAATMAALIVKKIHSK